MSAAQKVGTVVLVVVMVVLSPFLASWMAVNRRWRRHHDAPMPRRAVA